MRIQHVIFDLDGTLVDSAPGILASLRVALESVGLAAAVPLERGLIGPPLTEIVQTLLPHADAETRTLAIEGFKTHYDSIGVLGSVPYDGIDECLDQLRSTGIQLWIATNKRRAPTSRLMHEFGWSSIFEGVYSLDSFCPPKMSKAELLEQVLQVRAIDRRGATYIGDRTEDEEAAAMCGLHFLKACWGYGNLSFAKSDAAVDARQIPELIRKRQRSGV